MITYSFFLFSFYSTTQEYKAPSPRERMGCATYNQKAYMYGGLGAGLTMLSETWTYDFSPAYPPVIYSDCSQVLKKLATPSSGYYWVNFEAGTAYEVYCDMETDGGGWMLVTSQQPNGMLAKSASMVTINYEDMDLNQKLPQGVFDGMSKWPIQVMVEENPGTPDSDAGVIMVTTLSFRHSFLLLISHLLSITCCFHFISY